MSITKKQAQELYAFCITHKQDEFFIAKDSGAYFGCTSTNEAGHTDRCIQYLEGMNPDRDVYYYETSRQKLGGDDFAVHLNVDWLKIFCMHPNFSRKRKMSIRVNKNSVTLTS